MNTMLQVTGHRLQVREEENQKRKDLNLEA